VIVGDLGIVVQVKSRKADSSDTAKEKNWIEKQVKKGLRQGRGTVRLLKRQPSQLRNARGRTLEIDGNSLRWLVTVVIDHPSVPEGVVIDEWALGGEGVVLLRRDWEFLFDQLKSIHGVGVYLERVAGEPLELGEEPVRMRLQSGFN
jgi:hypothetical protein